MFHVLNSKPLILSASKKLPPTFIHFLGNGLEHWNIFLKPIILSKCIHKKYYYFILIYRCRYSRQIFLVYGTSMEHHGTHGTFLKKNYFIRQNLKKFCMQFFELPKPIKNESLRSIFMSKSVFSSKKLPKYFSLCNLLSSNWTGWTGWTHEIFFLYRKHFIRNQSRIVDFRSITYSYSSVFALSNG